MHNPAPRSSDGFEIQLTHASIGSHSWSLHVSTAIELGHAHHGGFHWVKIPRVWVYVVIDTYTAKSGRCRWLRVHGIVEVHRRLSLRPPTFFVPLHAGNTTFGVTGSVLVSIWARRHALEISHAVRVLVVVRRGLYRLLIKHAGFVRSVVS